MLSCNAIHHLQDGGVRKMRNKYVRAIVPSILAILIGITGNVFFSDMGTTWGTIALCVFAICLIVEIALTVYYVKSDEEEKDLMQNKDDEIKKLSNELEEEKRLKNLFSGLLEDLNTCYNSSAEKIYSLVDNAKKTQTIDLHIWNYHNITDFVCTELYKLVKNLAEKGGDFSVSYIARQPNPDNDKTEYLMFSYYGSETAKPHLYNYSISKKNAEQYYFGKLFKKDNPSVSYLMDAQEVAANFYYSDASDKGKYSQYIGIPVFCSGNHMIGLLQVVAHRGSKIAESRSEAEELVNKYIMSYANFILFAEKVQKGITFVPTK